MVKANYHTHHKLCNHAVGDVEDYVKQAIEYGFEEIGISDHAPVPLNVFTTEQLHENMLHRNMQYDEYYDIYLKELDEIIPKYDDKISILRGIEAEYIPGQLEYYKKIKTHLDYMLVGIHFFIDGKNVYNSYKDVNHETVLKYAKAASDAMDTGIYEILVHPDLFRFAYKGKDGTRKFDEYCEKATRMIVESAIKNDVYLEVNANGPSNSRRFGGSQEWLYPDVKFWEIVSEYKNVKVILGSDAHDPKDLMSDDLLACKKMVEDLGIKFHDKIKL